MDADIYFRVGKEFKLESILLDKLKSNINKIVDCSENINIIDRDPHFWLSTENAKIITQTITDSLSFYYPQHKNYFNNNKSQFFNEIDSAVSIIKNVLEKKQEKTLFVYHPAWRYFVEEFGLIQIAIEREGKHPTAGDLKGFVESAKDKGANCIFFDPHFDTTAVSTVANPLNIKIVSINPLPENYTENLFDIANKLNECQK